MSCASMHRSGARAGMASVLLAVALGCRDAPTPPASRAPPSLLLITVDTLRADRLGSYGYRLPTSPAMDALATRGVAFADCTATWPKTWPSLASVLTGLHPRGAGVLYGRRRLPASARTLAEILSERGWQTAAVVANLNLGAALGFDQGFGLFVESWQERGQGSVAAGPPCWVKASTNATLVTDPALRWLGARKREHPFFLWLHYMDPHGPYLPPVGYSALFADAHPARSVPLARLPRYQRQKNAAGREVADLGFYHAQYDREVRYLDDELGRLLARLPALGYDPRDMLVALTADHGESLGEHRYFLDHGKLPYQGSALVPLIFAWPGRLPSGRRVNEPVSLVDLPATLLDLSGIPVPSSFEGKSLAPRALGGARAPSPAPVFMESGYRERTQLSIRSGPLKLVHVRAMGDRDAMTGAEYELYDLSADPDESRNLAGEQQQVVARLAGMLDAWETHRRKAELEAVGEDGRMAPRDIKMLRSLGYVQ